jgi:hypothetical protein
VLLERRRNKGSRADGFHRINSGKYIIFDRKSDPASGDNCVLSMLGNWSSNSGNVPGHDYMELAYDNDFHRYVNTNGTCPCPATNFMTALANFTASASNEDYAAGTTYDWNKTAADYRTVRLVDDNNATRRARTPCCPRRPVLAACDGPTVTARTTVTRRGARR